MHSTVIREQKPKIHKRIGVQFTEQKRLSVQRFTFLLLRGFLCQWCYLKVKVAQWNSYKGTLVRMWEAPIHSQTTLEVDEWSGPRSGCFIPRINPKPITQEYGRATRPCGDQGKPPHTVIRFSDRKPLNRPNYLRVIHAITTKSEVVTTLNVISSSSIFIT